MNNQKHIHLMRERMCQGATTASHYSLGKRFAKLSVALRFDPEALALICLPAGGEETIRLPLQGETSAELMGELAVVQSLPIYQGALPFSLAACRQLEYAQNLTGTTLGAFVKNRRVRLYETRQVTQRQVSVLPRWRNSAQASGIASIQKLCLRDLPRLGCCPSRLSDRAEHRTNGGQGE